MSDEFEIFVEPDEAETSLVEATRVIAFAGARGGIGTSLACSSVAMYLGTIGRRVLVVDADPIGHSLHSHLGQRFGQPQAKPLAEVGVVLQTLRFEADSLTPVEGWLDADEQGAFEYVVVDLGHAPGRWALSAYLDADLSIFVTAPDRIAMDNMGLFLRRAFDMYLEKQLADDGADVGDLREVEARIRESAGDASGGIYPAQLLRRLQAEGSELAPIVERSLAQFMFFFMVSLVRRREDTEIGNAVRSVIYRRLRLAAEPLGFVDHDDAAVAAMRIGRPMLIESPMARASKCFERLTRRIVGLVERDVAFRTPRPMPFESHHGVLEVEREASAELIRRSAKRLLSVFAEDAIWLGGLYADEDLRRLRAQIEEARDTLLDKSLRRDYERSLFDEHGVYEEPGTAPTQKQSSMPPPPLITPETEFGGALIRAVRESQGITLRDVSETTRVALRYLQAIEDEDFESLPAAVYVRGFVSEFAKCLRLDGAQVSRTYLQRYSEFQEGGA